jgi:cytoskeletal protein CcmA (bactofilin family)
MDPEKNTEKPADEKPAEDAPADAPHQDDAPADALSRTPEELAEEQGPVSVDPEAAAKEKKVSPIKRFFKKVNVYLLGFVIVVIIAGAIALVSYLNSQQAPEEPNIATQELTEDALKQLANTDASVGNTSQTLTIQGNAIISGQTLMRGNLNVAGNIQAGGSLQAPTITVSGAANLGDAQINSLQVATNTAIQGATTLRDLTVAGAAAFNGSVTASQLTVTRLIMSGNATLEVPNHLGFTGPTPSLAPNNGVIGNGGTISISGSDTAGFININTGNNPTPGCFARINFRQAFTNQPRVIVGPVGAGAGQTDFYVERNNTGFNICTVNAAPANRSFAYDYFVTN